MERDSSPDGGLRGDRTGSATGRAREWLLVDGPRLPLAGAAVVAVFVGLVGLEATGVVAFEDGDTVTRLAGGTVAGVLSLITIVLAINQLVMNPELGNADQATQRLEAARRLADELEARSGVEAAPAEPVDFLAAVVHLIERDVEAVADAVGEDHREAGLEDFLDHLRLQTDRATALLADASFQTYNEVLVRLHRETSWQLFEVRRVRQAHRDDLPEEATGALRRLQESLDLFQVGQNYFKTTYVQRELTYVSRLMLFSGVPAVLAGYAAGLVYGAADGATLPAAQLPVAVAGLLAVALSPAAIFGAYLLRVATLIRRTPHVGPFTTQQR